MVNYRSHLVIPDQVQRGIVPSVSFHELDIGGDVNVTDEDGDTPLYTVEDVATARWLVEHGAVVDRTNGEGVSVCIVLPLRLH